MVSARARRGAVLLMGLAMSTTATACTHLTGAGQPSPAEPEMWQTFYSQKIDWKPCRGADPPPGLPQEGPFVQARKLDWSLECATVTVPLDYTKPEGERIQLAVNRSKATDRQNRIGSLLINPGGPGESGLVMAAIVGPWLGQLVTRGRYDVIGFDPRGGGQSSPVRCLPGPEEDRFNQLDSTPDTQQERQALEAGLKRYAEACQQNSGNLLPYVGTENAARDMDVMRAALGDEKLNFYGISYGTELGQVYAETYPRNVGRMVIDSIVDPADWLRADSDRIQEASFERELDEFLAWCGSDGACPVDRQGLAGLLAKLDQQPMQVAEAPDRPVTESQLRKIIGESLYSTEEWPDLESLLQAAIDGNAAVLRQTVDQSNHRDPQTGEYGGADDAYSAISCLTMPDADRQETQTAAADQQAREAAPLMASSPLSPCSYWPVPATMQPHPISAEGAGPILMVNNSRDPATPVEWSRAVAERLNGDLVVNDGDGHGVLGKSPCFNDIVARYLIDGAMPGDDTTCADNGLPAHQPPPPAGN